MVTLELIDLVAGTIFYIDRAEYGRIIEKYLKLAPAIKKGWSLRVVTVHGQVVRDSNNE